MGSCFDKHAKVLSNFRIGDREQWLDALARSFDKPRMEHCEDQNATIVYTRAVQGETANEYRRKRETERC